MLRFLFIKKCIFNLKLTVEQRRFISFYFILNECRKNEMSTPRCVCVGAISIWYYFKSTHSNRSPIVIARYHLNFTLHNFQRQFINTIDFNKKSFCCCSCCWKNIKYSYSGLSIWQRNRNFPLEVGTACCLCNFLFDIACWSLDVFFSFSLSLSFSSQSLSQTCIIMEKSQTIQTN